MAMQSGWPGNVYDRLIFERNGCVRWTGPTPLGYGRAKFEGRLHMVHRLVWMDIVGPIPEGMQLDHLCHNRDPDCDLVHDCPHRACVNPAHLEPVTKGENTRRKNVRSAGRKTRCVHGHEYTDATRMIDRRGRMMCRICHRYRSYLTEMGRRHPDQLAERAEQIERSPGAPAPATPGGRSTSDGAA